MSTGSARDRQFSGRKQNDEAEPFLVRQIPGSPVMRGRRQNSEEERFLVEDMSGSPIMRGRVPRVIPSRSSQDEAAGTLPSAPPLASSNLPGLNSTSDTPDGPARTAPTATITSSEGYATRPTHPRPPDNDDAPPSYESSIPPNNVGWATQVNTTVPFPMPYSQVHGDGRTSATFSYPSTDGYPPIGLLPLTKSYQSLESGKSRSLMRSTSPSPCPSPDRWRPAYTYQPRELTRTPPPRPRFETRNDDHFAIKPRNEFSYKYGSIIITITFVAFLMVLSLGVKFLIRSSTYNGSS